MIGNIAFADVFGSVREFLGNSTYSSQRNLINVLFRNKNNFINKSTRRADSLEILRTLKKNNLLELSFDSPKELSLRFDTRNHPVLAMKIINNTLENLGYTYYLVDYITKQQDSLEFSIKIKAQNLIDPVIFSDMLIANFCQVLKIRRTSRYAWAYSLDFSNAKLEAVKIKGKRQEVLGKPNRPYWIDVDGVKKVKFEAHPRDHWFAFITFFDKNLHVVKDLKLSKRSRSLHVSIPSEVKYLKVEDKYLLDNIKHGLVVKAD